VCVWGGRGGGRGEDPEVCVSVREGCNKPYKAFNAARTLDHMLPVAWLDTAPADVLHHLPTVGHKQASTKIQAIQSAPAQHSLLLMMHTLPLLLLLLLLGPAACVLCVLVFSLTPAPVLDVLLDMLSCNDNSANPVDDGYWLAGLVAALGQLRLASVADLARVGSG